MEKPLTEYDATEDVAGNVNSGWVNGVSTLITQRVAWTMTGQQALPAGDVACEALHLSLVALHIDIAWHPGVMSAEAAISSWALLHGLVVLDQGNLLEESRPEQERIAIQGVLAVLRGLSERHGENQDRRTSPHGGRS